jgi:hypothetical protein
MHGIDGCDTGNGRQIQVFRAGLRETQKKTGPKAAIWRRMQPWDAWIIAGGALNILLYDQIII